MKNLSVWKSRKEKKKGSIWGDTLMIKERWDLWTVEDKNSENYEIHNPAVCRMNKVSLDTSTFQS